MERMSVLGAGLMGHTIALFLAWRGAEVKLLGTDEADLERARRGVAEKLERLAAFGMLREETAGDVSGRVAYTTRLEEALAGRTFVFEAIPEDLELKRSYYERLDALCPPDVVLASNTSGLAPSAIAARMRQPERMVVAHFWNPAHLMPLVEIVGGERTSRETIERTRSLLVGLGKRPIEVRAEVPGFIGNRLQYALFREAQHLLEIGAASREDIDAAVVYGIGRRLPVTGPLMSADLGGLDVFHAISEYLFPDLAADRGSLATMRSLVARGHFGRKSGRGFYEWDSPPAERLIAERERVLIEFLRRDEADRENGAGFPKAQRD